MGTPIALRTFTAINSLRMPVPRPDEVSRTHCINGLNSWVIRMEVNDLVCFYGIKLWWHNKTDIGGKNLEVGEPREYMENPDSVHQTHPECIRDQIQINSLLLSIESLGWHEKTVVIIIIIINFRKMSILHIT